MLCLVFPTDKIKSIPNITPVLITIDPERDTAEAMAAYVKGINTKFCVLYGVKLWFINKVESGDVRAFLWGWILSKIFFLFLRNSHYCAAAVAQSGQSLSERKPKHLYKAGGSMSELFQTFIPKNQTADNRSTGGASSTEDVWMLNTLKHHNNMLELLHVMDCSCYL